MTATRLALVWSVLILVLCSVPGESIPVDASLLSLDKWVHAGLFAAFGALWLRARPGRGWAIFALGVAFGVGIEIWQGALPIGRSADVLDAVADVVGLVAGLGAQTWWSNHSPEAVSR